MYKGCCSIENKTSNEKIKFGAVCQKEKIKEAFL